VASPTFAIVNEYKATQGPIYHFDFYRIRRLSEAQDMGFDDYLYSGHLCFIEWPELIEPLLPDDAVRVTIEELPDGSREITF
jgi:tRNA threonylcarbamoyladenosine biosynthesis protein TsaE